MTFNIKLASSDLLVKIFNAKWTKMINIINTVDNNKNIQKAIVASASVIKMCNTVIIDIIADFIINNPSISRQINNDCEKFVNRFLTKKINYKSIYKSTIDSYITADILSLWMIISKCQKKKLLETVQQLNRISIIYNNRNNN